MFRLYQVTLVWKLQAFTNTRLGNNTRQQPDKECESDHIATVLPARSQTKGKDSEGLYPHVHKANSYQLLCLQYISHIPQ